MRLWETSREIFLPIVAATRPPADIPTNLTLPTEGELAVEPPQQAKCQEESHALDAKAELVVAPIAPAIELPEYKLTCLDKGDPNLFFESRSMSTLAVQLLKVIETEGPVSQAILFKRVTRAWGLTRVGSRIEAHLSALVPKQVARTRDSGITFYWPEHANPSIWDGFRVPGSEPETRRSIDEISLEELGNAAVHILMLQGVTSQDGLAKAVCRLLGVARTTADAGARIAGALTHGRVKGIVSMQDGLLRLRK